MVDLPQRGYDRVAEIIDPTVSNWPITKIAQDMTDQVSKLMMLAYLAGVKDAHDVADGEATWSTRPEKKRRKK